MLTFPLEVNVSTPLYQQIYQAVRERILDGRIPADTKLPSTRTLSANLGVSRNTVDTAYYQLQAEGYIEAAPQRGFFVCPINPLDYEKQGRVPRGDAFLEKQDTESVSAGYHEENSHVPSGQKYQYDFSPYAIDISHFPFSVWRKLSRQVLLDQKDLFLLGENQGDLSLRQAICRYVCLSRQVNCTPGQIIVGAGVDYLLQMLSIVFRFSGRGEITMENPGYMQAVHIFQNNGLKVLPGRLDEKGLVVDSISEESEIVYVTPSHQYPLGAVMPFGRREELLAWANETPYRCIIEDDHDSEFRYKGKPIPSLQGMDKNSRVIYIGTFSKAIAPAIRVGYMILPNHLMKVYQQVCGHYSCTVSRIDQEILARFLAEGYFEKHMNRMRKIYREKHDLVLECLRPLIERYHIRLHGEHAGLHVVLELPEEGIGEDKLLEIAGQAGIRLYGIGTHYLQEQTPTEKIQGILLGYSNLSEEDIKKGIAYMEDFRIFQNIGNNGNNTCNFGKNRLT